MSVDSSFQFVDTNIFIYAYDTSAAEKHTFAKKLVGDLWKNEQGVISIQVLQELFINLTRKVTHPLDLETASKIIADLGHWAVHRPEVQDVLDAIRLHHDKRISFWDAMILVSAEKMGCDRLWSEDLNAGQIISGVKIMNPFQ
jgi:predicted nucleic acid-binding protein